VKTEAPREGVGSVGGQPGLG